MADCMAFMDEHAACCVLHDCYWQGDVDLLQQWTGEACFNKLALEAKQRKAEGVVLVRERQRRLKLAVEWYFHGKAILV